MSFMSTLITSFCCYETAHATAEKTLKPTDNQNITHIIQLFSSMKMPMNNERWSIRLSGVPEEIFTCSVRDLH